MKRAMHFLDNKKVLFYWTSIVLFLVLLLYPLMGGSLMFLLAPETGHVENPAQFDEGLLELYRVVQVLAQVFFLGLPVFFLASIHTRERLPFSQRNFRFLGFNRKSPAKGLLIALLGVLLLQPCIYSLMAVIDYLFYHAGDVGRAILETSRQQEDFLYYLAGADSFTEFLVVACIVALVPAVCEELFFRGYIQRNYVESLSPARGILLTSVLFGLFHFSPANLVPLFCMGWFLGYLYETSKSLVLPIAVHFSNNLLSLVVLQFQREDSRAIGGANAGNSFEGWMMIVLTTVSIPLFILAMKKFRNIFS